MQTLAKGSEREQSMELEYIKANGVYYKPQPPGIKDKSKSHGNYPICTIKKLLFGRWKIEMYDDAIQYQIKRGYSLGDEDTPNTKIIIYPSGIEEIKWT